MTEVISVKEWQRELATSFTEYDGSPLLVDFVGADERARVRFGPGGLEFMDSSGGGSADLAIRMSEHSLREAMLGPADRVAAYRDAEAVAGAARGPVLPAAEAKLLRDARFEPIPGASLVAVIRTTSTVFGDIGMVERWVDGVLTRVQIVPGAEVDGVESDLRLTCSVAQLAALRRREITPPEVLAAGADLKSDWPYMGCYFGLIQHPAFAEAYRDVPAPEAQIALGEALSSPAYREAAARAQAKLAEVA